MSMSPEALEAHVQYEAATKSLPVESAPANDFDVVTYSTMFRKNSLVTFERKPSNEDTTRRRDSIFSPTGQEQHQAELKLVLGPLFRTLDHETFLSARKVCTIWRDIAALVRPQSLPAFFRLPIEVIQIILSLLDPAGFNNARRTCKAWYWSSFSVMLLREKLSTMGFAQKDPLVRHSRDAGYLTKRLARECALGGNDSGECALKLCGQLDISDLASSPGLHFTVSVCGTHAMMIDGCVIYVYRLMPLAGTKMEFVGSVVCPRRVLAVSMDTSNRRHSVAVLMVRIFSVSEIEPDIG